MRSLPLPPSNEHIIVEETGRVDKDYYPIYDTTVSKERHLLIETKTFRSKTKAESTIIFHPINELQTGDEIEFHLRPRRWDADAVTHGTGTIRSTHNGNYQVYLDAYKQCIDIPHYRAKSDKNDYGFTRSKSNTPSRLFTVAVRSKQDLFTEMLEHILTDQPYDILNQISSFLHNEYERKVYFDCQLFQTLVQTEYEHNNQQPCSLCTMLNPPDNTQCAMCENPLTDHHWLQSDRYYEHEIFKLSHRNHPSFPDGKHRHQMYAQKAYLPKISETQRLNLQTIQTRLQTALKPSTSLYKYQLHTVLWCFNVERSVLAQQKLCIGAKDLHFALQPNCKVYNVNGNFLPATVPHVIPPRLLSFKGGIIADDVGLGKSLTVLSLIASHPLNDGINSLFQLGPNKQSIQSGATLLIAPSHLIEQWKHEIEKHFKNQSMNIVVITTAPQHDKVSYRNVLSAHVVLVSSQFIASTHYKFYRMGANNHTMELHRSYLNPSLPPKPKGYVEPKRKTTSRSRSKAFKIQYHDLDKTNIFFELIYWRRIVLDEAPDYLYNVDDVVFSINSAFKWFVSATPFPNEETIGLAAMFLGINFERKDDRVEWNKNLNKPIGNVLHCIIYHHLLSRHTKESILEDNHLPDTVCAVQYADFHPIERMFYDIVQSRRDTSKEDRTLERAICSGILKHFQRNPFHVFRDDANYLHDLLRLNRSYYPAQMTRLQNDINDEEICLQQLQVSDQELEDKKKEFETNGEAFTLAKAYPNLREREQYSRIKQKIVFARKRIKRMKIEIQMHMKEYQMVQNQALMQSIMNFETEFKKKTDGALLLRVVQKYGSKQAVLLEYIKLLHQNVKNRIIIFSFFGETLQQLQSRLSQMGVHAVLCRGNIHQRRKALSSFQVYNDTCDNGGKRIILLSVDNAASGANLNRATHVVLVDPVAGSSSEAFAKEKQAVGRAVRQGMRDIGRDCTKVIRFVVRNSIEQETFERNQKLRTQPGQHAVYWNQCFNGKRTKNEIDFYIKIKENTNKGIGRKRKNCEDDGMNEIDCNGDNDDMNNSNEPPSKRRKLK